MSLLEAKLDEFSREAEFSDKHEFVGETISYRKASTIKAQPIHWLWNGRIARGKVTMLAGHPGLGKSQVTASLAAIVSTGGTWPVDCMTCDRGSVIILSAEDDASDTIVPRLKAAGADLDRIAIIDPVPVSCLGNDGLEIRRSFTLETDLLRLEKMLVEMRDVALVIIDPISAFLGKTDSHQNAEVRAVLAPLSDLAAKYEAAFVCVSHFNKSTGSESKMRVMGSLAFVAAARAVFGVFTDPDDRSRRLFLPVKNNIGNDQTGLAFSIQEAEFLEGGVTIGVSKVIWEAEPVTLQADDVLSASSEERDATTEAVEWLRNLLADGPMKVAEIQKEARGAGIGDKALRTARERICQKPYKQDFASGWWWRLKGSEDAQAAQDAEDAQGAIYKNRASSGVEGIFEGQKEVVSAI